MGNDTAGTRPRVLVAEDNALLRYTVKLIVETQYELVGEASDGAEAIRLAEELRPDVVLLDVSMPLMTGLEAARVILERLPEVRVVMVSNHTSALYIDEALQIGAHGYVSKGSAMVQIPRAIDDAMAGRVFRPT